MSISKRRTVHLLLAFIFVIIGVMGFKTLKSRKKPIVKQLPPVTAPVVETIITETGRFTVPLRGEGTVIPVREINLVPQIAGKIIFVSPLFVNGGQFLEGEILIRIDPMDYRLGVSFARAKVKDAESRLKLTEEEAAVAREEWQFHPEGDQAADTEPPPLVAKEPQLAAAQATLEAAQADLERAELNLARTEIKAPFNGRVSKKVVDIGQYVAPGTPLGIIFSTDAAEIIMPLEDQDLFWFHVPGFTPGKGPGASARIHALLAGHQRTWQGHVVRAEGKLDTRTRMINVVIRVENPYETMPPLAVGLFVNVAIDGHAFENASIIPRSALRQGEQVWMVNGENKLIYRKVTIGRVQGEEAFIQSGLDNGEEVIISPLKAVTQGMTVQRIKPKK